MISSISIKTKFGWISAFEEKGKIIRVKFGKHKSKSINKNLAKFKTNLNSFLMRKSKFIKSNFLIEGNSTQKKIWRELKNIKLGETKTYGEIAKKYKLSPRHVGKICSQNKIAIAIPCHRVIKSAGTLGGYSGIGGIELKNKLLKFEKKWKQ